MKADCDCPHCGQPMVMCGECNELWCDTCQGAQHEESHNRAEDEEYERRREELDREFGR